MGVHTSRGGSVTTDVIGYRNGENLFRNPSFNINQRNVSGTVTLAAGAYGHDGLIASGNGATYTFALAANGVDTIITLTAGQLVLPVAPELIDGSQLCFTYTGTAGFRIATNQTVAQGGSTGTGTAWNAPGLATGTGGYNFIPTANTQVNIMFGDTKNANNSVTFSVPQLERVIANTTPTRFQRRDPADELLRCQRYAEVLGTGGVGTAQSNQVVLSYKYAATKRANPTLSLLTTSIAVYQPTVSYQTGSGCSLSTSVCVCDQVGCTVGISGFSGLTNGYFIVPNQSAFLLASAELT